MVSFHPPHFDSLCSQILFRWRERSLQIHIKQTFRKEKRTSDKRCVSEWEELKEVIKRRLCARYLHNRYTKDIQNAHVWNSKAVRLCVKVILTSDQN